MATTKSGNPSAMHPTLNMTWKRAFKIERIARLSIDPAGYTNEQIANVLGCDKQTVVLIRQLPEYHAKMIEVTTGVTSDWDREIRSDAETSRAEMRATLPSAMMVIRNALYSKNENVRFKAALEVLDREGTHAKVSKTQVNVTKAPDMAIDPLVSANLMSLLAGAPQILDADSRINVGSFTISASAATIQQASMADESTIEAALEDLDLSDTKPN